MTGSACKNLWPLSPKFLIRNKRRKKIERWMLSVALKNRWWVIALKARCHSSQPVNSVKALNEKKLFSLPVYLLTLVVSYKRSWQNSEWLL